MQQYLSKRAINNTVKLVKLYLPSLARGRRTIRDSSQLNCGGGRARGRLAVQLQERSFRKIWPTISSCSAPGIRGNKFMRSINLSSAKTQDPSASLFARSSHLKSSVRSVLYHGKREGECVCERVYIFELQISPIFPRRINEFDFGRVGRLGI